MKAQIITIASNNRLDSSKLKSNALSIEADAELAQGSSLDPKRKHE